MSVMAIAAAWGLDIVFGDPEKMPHPVRGIGKLVSLLEVWARKNLTNERVAGAIVGIAVPASAYVCTIAVIWFCSLIHGWFGAAASVVLIYTTLSSRCLSSEACRVYMHLKQGDVIAARKQVARIVGRDTLELKEAGVVRAAIESVSENCVDGIIAPLFYAVLGGAPLAMAYKAINTLDSMVGYKDERYRDFGWFSARMDDVANFIPARLCIIIIPFACLVISPGRALKAFTIMVRDGVKNPSPNAGYPESGFAGALGIQLGGTVKYRGYPSEKPLLGDPEKELGIDDIRASIHLMWAVSCTALVLLLGAALW